MIDPTQISLCLITKDKIYPKEILANIANFEWGEILILTHCDSPHRKHELFAKAKFDILAYQDDDAICPWLNLLYQANPIMINLATKQQHFDSYNGHRTAVGFGWGVIFPKSILASLQKYRDVYGEDELYKRETERILMCLNYPQNRFVLPIVDLPSAFAADRLSMQPGHYDYIPQVEERCKLLLKI